MKQSVIRESLQHLLGYRAETLLQMERGFSNPQEYADKNVRAPFDSELRVLRGEDFFLIWLRFCWVRS
jgi:hypothetical protein